MANEVKFKIEIARGDSYEKGFVFQRGTSPVTEVFDDVYFTVKKYYTDEDFVFQKRQSTGGITRDNTPGHYTLFIDPEDTNGLPFGDYDADFEFRKGNYKKTFYGKLKLAKEVTHQNNE